MKRLQSKVGRVIGLHGHLVRHRIVSEVNQLDFLVIAFNHSIANRLIM